MAFKLRSGNKSSFKSMESSPAKGSGTEALAMSQARLNNQTYQKRLNEQAARDNKPSKSINAITGTPLLQEELPTAKPLPNQPPQPQPKPHRDIAMTVLDKTPKGKIVYKDGKKYYQASDGSLHTGQVDDYERELAQDKEMFPDGPKSSPNKQIELALLRKRKGLGPREIKGEDDQSYEAAVTRKEMGMTKKYPYYYKINGQNVSKEAYKKYENKPGGDEPGKQTNDPDVYGRKANNYGRGPKTK